MAGGRRKLVRNGANGSGASGVEPEAAAPNPEMAAILQLLQRQQEQMDQLQQQVVQMQREREPPAAHPIPPPTVHPIPPPAAHPVPPPVDLPPPPFHPPPVDHLLEQFLKL